MPDLNKPGQDVDIVDPSSGYTAGVTSTGRLKVDATVNVGEVVIKDNTGKKASVGAFDILKTAQEISLGYHRFSTHNLTENWIQTATGSGAVSVVGGMAKLSTGASTNSSMLIETHRKYEYQSARGHIIRMSIVTGDTGVSGNVREWGYYDDDNGFFFRLDGTTLKFVRRSGGIDNEILASAWDVPTTIDANGHIWTIQFQWLGVGDIYIYRDSTLVHTINYAGTSQFVSIENPDLSMRLYNSNTTNNTDVTLKSGCVDVSSEGGFDKISTITHHHYDSSDFNIPNIGGFNDFLIPVQIENENMEGSGDIIKSLDGTTTDVIQVFRASADNINEVEMMLSTSGGSNLVNNCDTLGDWTTSDAGKFPISIDTTIKQTGTGSLKMDVVRKNSDGETVTYSFTSQDWSADRTLLFYWRQDQPMGKNNARIVVSDGTNSAYQDITISQINTWEKKEYSFDNFLNLGASSPNFSAITSIYIECTKDKENGNFWIDDINRQEAYGTVDLEFYDFGSSPTPTSLGTPITLDSGGTAITKTIEFSQKKIYGFHIYGEYATLVSGLTIGNYYGICITNKSSSNITVNVHGKSTGNYYKSGGSRYSTDNGTTVSSAGSNSDLFFLIFSKKQVYIKEIKIRTDSALNDGASMTILIEDNNIEKINKVLVHDYVLDNIAEHTFKFDDPVFLKENEKIELVYNHAGGSERAIYVTRHEFYIPFNFYG